ncbi:type VII secretion-associated protein,c family [Mycobacterium basiliense]|uniref:Type VII secretion-associated protein,c family n=1 Tax=Mycobacterium basiliense TaxID=2094119 RepID=A0A3S5CZJ9_9MYCO|nr:type VII secretion-associated protein [Mycobacterium basiliense]VDM87426.1 type VII secretion-associated protein,c family [Mycobacterium basiliense]
MNAHRAVIEAGPGAIRLLCCDTGGVVDSEVCAAALEAVDDEVVLVDERPVAVGSLWSASLRSLASGHRDGMTIVHPTWWSPSRIAVVNRAARAVTRDAGDVEVRPRSWLLRRAATPAAVVVEIADRLLAVVYLGVGERAGEHIVAVPRRSEPQVAEAVVGVVAGMMGNSAGALVVDAPSAVAEASALSGLVRGSCGDRNVVEVSDGRLAQLARLGRGVSLPSAPAPTETVRPGRRVGRLARLAVVIVAVTTVAVVAPDRHGPPAARPPSAAVLVEGRVALTVPAGWTTRRVVGGPGSARVQITSPTDPEMALHLTQSPVPGGTLAGTAERLKRAIDAEPGGDFVDFNPSGVSAGRPAVTYREVRAGHDVWWTVLLDGGVQISVGCQSRPAAQEAMRDVCECAVRSAHAIA